MLLFAEESQLNSFLGAGREEFSKALSDTWNVEDLTSCMSTLSYKRNLSKDERNSRKNAIKERISRLEKQQSFETFSEELKGYTGEFQMKPQGAVLLITSPQGETWEVETDQVSKTAIKREFAITVADHIKEHQPVVMPPQEPEEEIHIPVIVATDAELRTQKLAAWKVNDVVWHKSKGYGLYCGIQETATPGAWVNFGSYPEPVSTFLCVVIDGVIEPPPVEVGEEVLILNKNFGSYLKVATVESSEYVACDLPKQSIRVVLEKSLWVITTEGKYHRNCLLCVGDEVENDVGSTGIVKGLCPLTIAWSDHERVYDAEDINQLDIKLKHNEWYPEDLTRTFFKTVALIKYGYLVGDSVKIISGHHVGRIGYIDDIAPGTIYNSPSQKPQLLVKFGDESLLRIEPDATLKIEISSEILSESPSVEVVPTDRWKQGWKKGDLVIPNSVSDPLSQKWCLGHEVRVKWVAGDVGEIQQIGLTREDGETSYFFGNWIEEDLTNYEDKTDVDAEIFTGVSPEIQIGDKVRLLSTVRFVDIDPDTKLMPSAVLGFNGEVAEVCGVRGEMLALSIGGETFDYSSKDVEKVTTPFKEAEPIFPLWEDLTVNPCDNFNVGDRVVWREQTRAIYEVIKPVSGGHATIELALKGDGCDPKIPLNKTRVPFRDIRLIKNVGSPEIEPAVIFDELGRSLLLIELIERSGGTQIRVAIDQKVVEDYAINRREGQDLPPIAVFYDGIEYWLGDGFHRVEAEVAVGNAYIWADIRPGTRRDAILFSCGANATHGLRRTNADKRRAVETLLNDDEWGKLSNREVARRAGVDEKTVRNIRAEGAEIPHPGRVIQQVEVRNNVGATNTVPQDQEMIQHNAVSTEPILAKGVFPRSVTISLECPDEMLRGRVGVATSCPNIDQYLIDFDGTTELVKACFVEEISTNPKSATSVQEETKEWGRSLGIPVRGLPDLPRNEGIEPEGFYDRVAKTELAIAQVLEEVALLTPSQVNKLLEAIAVAHPSATHARELDKLSLPQLNELIEGAQSAYSRLINQGVAA